MGLGRGTNFSETAWSTRNQLSITNAVKSGLRMFYFSADYDWSFIRPTRQATFVTGETSVALPDDFGGLEGTVRVIDSGLVGIPIKQTNEQWISRRYGEFPDVSGQPQYCAVRQPSTTSATKGQRANLYLYPVADIDYTIEFQMYLNPDALSASFPYALGGTTHIETIRAAVKAAAERDINNVQQGPQYQYYRERLQASISLDRRNKGQTFGQNIDPGYNQASNYRRSVTAIPITFDGADPG